MDSELEELESLFSDHFGRTPTASQTSDVAAEATDPNENEEPPQSTVTDDLETRTQRFFDECCDDEDEQMTGHVMPSSDDPDLEAVRVLKVSGCGCVRNCFLHIELTEHEIHTHLLNVREMGKSDKEMYIMSSLVDCDKSSTKRGKKRQRRSHEFTFRGGRVCKRTFMMLFCVGKHCLQNLMMHVSEHGVVPRSHGNTCRRPSKYLQYEDVMHVVQFISNYSDNYGMPQPAAPRGRDGTAPVYLTSDTTKASVHHQYVDSCAETDPPKRTVKYSTFNNIWRSCLPHIKIASPREDVCATCELLRKRVMDSVSEEEKLESSEDLRQHVLSAQKEREVYNDCIKRAKESHSAQDEDKYIHYTFDFSQSVSLPHHSRQMGPLYFSTLRKVQIFGFRIDGVQRQLNFLIDENETIGLDGTSTHGPNAVISMIHWAMETHHSGESSCTIHADNCPGQNKNKYVIGYFMWRIMTGRHTDIEFLMQVPGHARCLVDSGFASLKKVYRRSDCESMAQLQDIVDKSATSNEAVRYPTWQWRDWKTFLNPVIKPVRGIRGYQQFRLSTTNPGIIFVKAANDTEEIGIRTMRAGISFARDELPPVLAPAGLSQQRQLYLYKSVRPFVRHAHRDSLCPAMH